MPDTHIDASSGRTGQDAPARTVKVWDFPTRVFHWAFAAVVVLAFATSEGGGAIFTIHVFAGTVLLGFIAFRAVWGVIGSRHAQFGDFVHGPATVKDYLGRLMAFRPPYVVGHNPVGGWMVVAMLAVVLLAVLTGMMSSEDGYVGPLAHIGGGIFGEAHEGLGSFVMVLVGIHVVGVLAHGLVSGENLPRAMITGLKHVPGNVKALDIKPVGLIRPVVALVIGLAVVVYFMR